MRRFLKISLYCFIILITLFVLTSLTGIFLVKKHGDKIKDYALNSLNKELAVKVEIKKADITFFKTFPFISMVLQDAITFSGEELSGNDFNGINADTLFRAENIYIQFNIIDILKGNYKIKRILAENGELKILTDKQGNTNYKLFKDSRNTKGSERTLELEFFKIKNINFLLVNSFKDLNISGRVDDILLKGKFGMREFSFTTHGSLFLENLTREGIHYAENASVSTKINFQASDSVYFIEKGSLSINDLRFETSGLISAGEVFSTDLVVEGNDLRIRSLIRTLPDYLKKWSNSFIADGRADIILTIKGFFSGTKVPSIDSRFKLIQGSFKAKDWKAQLNNISFSGSYSNGPSRNAQSSIFEFRDLRAKFNDSNVTGNLVINNLLSPNITTNFKGDIKVTDINHFISNKLFSFTNGNIKPDVSVQVKLNSFKDFDLQKVLINDMSGECGLHNLAFIINENYPEITGLNGNVSMEKDSWLSDISFNSGKSNILFKGSLDHVLKRFVNKTSSLWIQGDVYSNLVDLSFLINRRIIDNTTDAVFLLPDKLYLKLNISLDNFELNKFRASGITSDLTYKPGFLSLTSLHLNTMKGRMESYGGLIQDMNGNLILRTSSQLEKIDIKEMFEVFNDFRQDFITSRNLEGRISGLVDFSAHLNAELIPEMETVYAESDVIIENGELKDFAPLNSLSRFIELSELEHVRFETLRNNIIIKDKKVIVPVMAINSTAFNITASGIHGFDNNFEYKVKINLSELLAKKARMKKENDEFAIMEKEGERVNIFLTIVGNPDDFRIRYDRKEAVNQIREDLKTEKKVLKSILYEEFGLFKKHFSDTIKPKESRNSTYNCRF